MSETLAAERGFGRRSRVPDGTRGALPVRAAARRCWRWARRNRCRGCGSGTARTPWLITGHEVARALFADSRVSVDDRIEGFPHWNEHMLSTVNKRPRSVFTSDAEEHTRFRRMLSKPFTFKRVEALRAAIQEVTDECIDAILAGPQPADIVSKLALPVPTKVISEMLGVPYEDHEFFQHHANVGLARYASAEDGQKGAMSLAQVPHQPRRDRRWRTRPRTRCPTSPSASPQARSASRRPPSWAPGC